MVNPLLATVVDAFTTGSLNLTLWNNTTGGGVVTLAAAGRVAIQATSANPQLGATGPYNATGQTLYARITPALAGTGAGVVQTVMTVQKDASNYAQLLCKPGTVWQASVVIAGTPTTVSLPAFDPTAHAWWKITESSGNWLFSVSADGAAWTQVASIAYSWSAAAVSVAFGAGSSTVSGEVAYVEHVNTLFGTTGLSPSWPQVGFQVAFNGNASMSVPPAYVDLSSRLSGSWSAQLSGRQYELDQIQSGQLTASLKNLDGALDPTNTSSPYYPNVLPMKPCRMIATWPPTRNLMDAGLANGTGVGLIGWTFGSIASGTVPAAPTGHTTATEWTFAAHTANTCELWQGLSTEAATSPASQAAISLTGGGGGTWSSTVWVSSAVGTATGITAVLQLCWYDATGTQLSVSAGSGITIPASGTWTQATVTAAAPATAVSCRPAFLITSTTSASSTVLLTAWQTELASTPTPWASPGIAYPLWAGFVERWPQSWDHSGTYGLMNITAVDALAALAQFTLNPSTDAQLLSLNPTRMYPLNEPSGSTTFRDVTGKHGPVIIGTSPYGAGTVTPGTSITGTGFVGAAGPVVHLANPAPSNTSGAGNWLGVPSPIGPPTSGGWTRIICFRTTQVPGAGTVMSLWSAQGISATNPPQALFYIDASQHVTAFVQNTAGQSMITSCPTVAVCDGNWHMATFILDPTGKLLNINVDGAGFFTTSANDCHPVGIAYDVLGANVVPSQGLYTWFFTGDLAYATEIPTNNVPSFSDIANGFATGWAGETSAARAQRILTLSGYSGALSSMDATTAMAGANLAGQGVMTALQLVADTENGQLYADGANTVQLAGRLWRYYQNAPAVFIGEQQASSGEIPYLDDISIEFDDTHIYNVAQITNSGPPGSTQQPYAQSINAASSAAYAPRTLQRTINVNDPTVPLYAAQYLTSQYGQPLARVAALTVDPASNPALWSQLLALSFGSRVQVSRRPPSGPGAQPIVLQQFLEHLAWDGDDQGNFRASMQLSAAQPFLGWWIISSLHTTVHTASNVGDTVITFNPLTGSTLNPAAAVLPPGTVLTLGYGDPVHSENVTVQSVAATSPGYASVAVTLTAATVHSHAVGAVVCQPLPGGYTLPALPAASFPSSLDAGATLSATTPRVSY
ncbi:hypothetical protein [Streptacidiphilus sp. EB129]|uniref:hypothetical protein n=1 Tax=Streptacidiphilus sp. EB129 TaxID=3156262 RepID=UPI0035110CE8